MSDDKEANSLDQEEVVCSIKTNLTVKCVTSYLWIQKYFHACIRFAVCALKTCSETDH